MKIKESIDLAVIATPMPKVPSIVRECVQAGVGSAIIISVGGKEIGPEGKALMENLMAIARDQKFVSMRGVVLAENTHMLTLAGKLGFSQSKIPGENQYDLIIDLGSIDID